MFDLLAPPQYILEDFEIDPRAMTAPHWIWCRTTGRWVKVSPLLYKMLEKLVTARNNVSQYRTYIHDPTSEMSCIAYKGLLDRVADIKLTLRNLANSFCIAYRGYSLN